MFCPSCGKENSEQARFCQSCGKDLAATSFIDPSAPQTIYRPVYFAGFWRRFVAFLIDTTIIFTATTLIGNPFGYNPFHNSGKMPFDPEFMDIFGMISNSWSGSLFSGIVTWLYYALMESSATQATLGKMALGIVVTDLSNNRISFVRATGRHVAKVLSAMTLLIGYIIAGFTAKKQALHDILASCLVVKK